MTFEYAAKHLIVFTESYGVHAGALEAESKAASAGKEIKHVGMHDVHHPILPVLP